MHQTKQLIFHLWKKWVQETCILNWSTLERCILVLIFFAVTNVLWAIWKGYILYHIELHQYVDLFLVKLQLKLNIILCLSSLCLIAVCYYNRTQVWIQNILPILCLAKFTVFFLRDGYLVGILSPATTVGTLSFVFLGILLFERRIIYSILIPTSILITYLIYQTYTGQLPYAPLFNTQTLHEAYKNPFWVASMLYFIVPLVAVSFISLEVVLEQWRYREHYVKKMGQYDALTEVYNRRMLNTELLNLEHQAQQHYVIIMIDLDHFKQINDRYGHMMGDRVLMNVAKVLQENLRDQDIVGRYGGEEFLMILKDIDADAVYAIAERCRQAIYELEHRIDVLYMAEVSASIGVAFSQTDLSVMQVLQAADEALYQAKSEGRNRICFAEPRLQSQLISV